MRGLGSMTPEAREALTQVLKELKRMKKAVKVIDLSYDKLYWTLEDMRLPIDGCIVSVEAVLEESE